MSDPGKPVGEAAPAGAHVGAVRAATVYVSDIERARRFYVDALGLEERRGGPLSGGGQRVEVAPPGAPTALVLVRPSLSEMGVERASVARQRIGEPTGLILETADVAAACDELRARGVLTGREPAPGVSGGTTAVIHDPDGNELVLVEAPAAGAGPPESPTPRT